MTANKTKKPYTIVSYFCGCGGLDLGFRGGYEYRNEKHPRLPFEILDAYDFNEKCVAKLVDCLEKRLIYRHIRRFAD